MHQNKNTTLLSTEQLQQHSVHKLCHKGSLWQSLAWISPLSGLKYPSLIAELGQLFQKGVAPKAGESKPHPVGQEATAGPAVTVPRLQSQLTGADFS